jgi:hypothetical protein
VLVDRCCEHNCHHFAIHPCPYYRQCYRPHASEADFNLVATLLCLYAQMRACSNEQGVLPHFLLFFMVQVPTCLKCATFKSLALIPVDAWGWIGFKTMYINPLGCRKLHVSWGTLGSILACSCGTTDAAELCCQQCKVICREYTVQWHSEDANCNMYKRIQGTPLGRGITCHWNCEDDLRQ